MQKVTVEQLREVAPDLSQAEAAQKFGVSREWIRQLANKHAIDFRDGKRLDPDDVSAMIEMAKTMTVKQIAEKTERSVNHVWQALHRRGVSATPGRRGGGVAAHKIQIDMTRVQDMRDRGESWRDIAKSFGYNTTTVWRRWVQHQNPGTPMGRLRSSDIKRAH